MRSAGGAGLYTALSAARAGAIVTMYAPRPEPMPEELAPALALLEWMGPVIRPDRLPRFEIANHEGGRTDNVTERLSGDVPARLDIASVEAQSGRRDARQFRLGVIDLIVPTLDQKIAPVYCSLSAINTGV